MADKEPEDQSAAASLGAKGGRARARNLTKEQKADIARKGAMARWRDKEVPVLAKYGAPDRPLRIGDITIPCYVLADGRRVLAQRGLQSGIGLSEGGGSGGERRMVGFLSGLANKGIDIRGLTSRIQEPILFIHPGGARAYGYEATILPDICAVIIEAHQQGKLQRQQEHLARSALIAVSAWV